MMNIDQARAGGEGMISSVKKKEKNEEKEKGPDLFQSEEQELNLEVPEGWRVGR